MQIAHIKRAEAHTYEITINGVTDTGFRLVWADPDRTEFRRTEGGDVEHVVFSGLPDGFAKNETFEADAEVLSISHPEMWTKVTTEGAAAPQEAPVALPPVDTAATAPGTTTDDGSPAVVEPATEEAAGTATNSGRTRSRG